MTKIIELGTINPDRLKFLPRRHWAAHEFCFHIHDYMVTLLQGAYQSGASDISVELKNSEEVKIFQSLADEGALDALEILGYTEDVKKALSHGTALALYGDFLHFIHDALIALEKRKFTVALTLLRKPLKENLFLAAWLCGDNDDFHRAFSQSPDLTMDGQSLSKNKRMDVLRKCLAKIEHFDFLNSELVYQILYDKNLDNGLANLFDKAAHLVTGSKPLLKTEKQNLNFIFKNPMDNDVYEFLYFRLSYLLIFSMLLQIELFNKMEKIDVQFVKYSQFITLGGHNAIFVGGSIFTRMIQSLFSEFLHCPHCKHKLKINRGNLARFLVAEKITCSSCNEESHFPLFWLFSKTDWDVPGSVAPK